MLLAGIIFSILVLAVLLCCEHIKRRDTVQMMQDQFRKNAETIKQIEDNIAQNSKAIQRISQTLADHEEIMDSLDRSLSETDDAILKIDRTLKKNQEMLEQTGRIISQKERSLREEIKALKDDMQELSAQNRELIKKLEFYTEIESDSTKLNEIEDKKKREELLDRISKTNDASLPQQAEEESVLDPEQQQALEFMENTNRNLFITGKAGTGKSFLLDAFVKYTGKRTLVMAPTGIAALNVGGVTLHSAFGFFNLEKLDVDDINEETVSIKSEKRLILRKVHTIIIDEMSMVRADTLDKIDKILRVVNRTDKLFGGKQIILFGDLFQLPPVVKRAEEHYLKDRYGGIFFFFSNAYRQGDFHFIELITNHRQKGDAWFFAILNRMREGKVTDEDIRTLNRRRISQQEGDGELRRVLTLFPTKAAAEKVNAEQLERIQGREYTYVAEVIKNTNNQQTANMESIFPITERLKLKVGALVMMVANDPGRKWVNGTMGIIKRLTEDKIFVMIDAREYEVDPVAFEEREAIYEDGKITYKTTLVVNQFPVVLAYAITIHKSQGMTYQRVACDISRCFAPGQAYVALSRCSRLAGLFLVNEINKSQVMVNRDVQEFYLRQIEE